MGRIYQQYTKKRRPLFAYTSSGSAGILPAFVARLWSAAPWRRFCDAWNSTQTSDWQLELAPVFCAFSECSAGFYASAFGVRQRAPAFCGASLAKRRGRATG